MEEKMVVQMLVAGGRLITVQAEEPLDRRALNGGRLVYTIKKPGQKAKVRIVMKDANLHECSWEEGRHKEAEKRKGQWINDGSRPETIFVMKDGSRYTWECEFRK